MVVYSTNYLNNLNANVAMHSLYRSQNIYAPHVQLDPQNMYPDNSYIVPSNTLPLPYVEQLPNTVKSYYATPSIINYMPYELAYNSNNRLVEGFGGDNSCFSWKYLLILIIIILLMYYIYKFLP